MNGGGADLRFADSKKTPMECRHGREGEMDASGRWGRMTHEWKYGGWHSGRRGGRVRRRRVIGDEKCPVV